MKARLFKPIVAGILVFASTFGTPLFAQNAQKPKYSAKVPESILTPDEVKSRIGMLKFTDGVPDRETSQRLYDNLDFSRGVEAFLKGMPATSRYAMCKGFEEAGIKPNQGIGITENLMDARTLFLTPNSTTVYVFACMDLKDGPIVVEVAPNVLGPVDDAYFRYVTDFGFGGPDGGKGGKYLFVRPGYNGNIPADGYHVQKTPTNGNLIIYRAFVRDGDVAAAVRSVKASARIYPLSAAANPPAQEFVNTSGKQFNTIHANDFRFYEELNAVVQNEPADAFDPETVGLFAAIGIKKGKPFAPDARMKAILTDAVAVGNATARAILFDSRDPRAKFYPDRQWYTGFIGGRYDFTENGERMLDARVLFHYYATGITPLMAAAKPGSGSAYAIAARDSLGRYFDGGKTYKITLPAPIPAKDFWSFAVYDNQTRSMLETDQALAGIDSNQPTMKKNPDGSATIWFGPKAPGGQEGNWVQTTPGKGWNTLLRLYGPLEPWFDKTWKPGDFELVD
ncbi:DUF1254 domain-containing protein [Bradyrhizobium japonicum]|uniref:DUF1254 domain-containing protein n=1 Tax=Bradyrhizobium japonicum TaxID=375 RepID=UPI002714E16C|nr:DUF1254 domain-containing protein [Bradyrhizobium japonicum]WLB55877.1 DUF1254 domain-containing protein [Bradyrhizobium japonicum]WLB62230.1 DUF1254 domain-containing protein [Bradyrhizobium japonicum]